MVIRFNLGDIIIYNKKICKITSTHSLNWALPDPLVYGLMTINAKTREFLDSKELYVCAHILDKISDEDLKLWKVLYGS